MKTIMSDLQSSVDKRLEKIEILINSNHFSAFQTEQIIQESVKRALRAPNVVLYNIIEDSTINDVDVANDILECVYECAVVLPDNVKRLRKINTNKPRPPRLSLVLIQLSLFYVNDRLFVTNNKFEKVKIVNDQTRSQQA